MLKGISEGLERFNIVSGRNDNRIFCRKPNPIQKRQLSMDRQSAAAGIDFNGISDGHANGSQSGSYREHQQHWPVFFFDDCGNDAMLCIGDLCCAPYHGNRSLWKITAKKKC